MDLLSRLAEFLDSHGWAQSDPAGQDPVNRNGQVSVTISVGRRKVDLMIGRRLATADETSDAPATAEETPDHLPEQDDCSWPEPHGPAPAPAFWDALDPTEREALRAVASWRTFAAGARLMEEGEPADHVMVILGGKVEVRLNENGRDRVLAIRGVGQLVGEGGALKVSVRSATVVALDLIWALVVETRDFAAFLTAHPRVRAIVQNQVDQRRSEGPAGYGRDYGPDHSGIGTGHRTTASDQGGPGLAAGYFRPYPRPLTGENCTVFLSDVVKFGARWRTDEDRRLIRDTLFRATQAALQDIPDMRTEDRGDGFLSVAPPTVSTARVMDRLLGELSAALGRHNGTHRESARFQLRLAVNVGPVVSDAAGVTGETIIVTARLVEAPHFKMTIEGSTASLGVIASPFVYETVIRHDRDPGYSEVPVEVKESETTAWMRLFGPPTRLEPAPREAYLRPLIRIL
jgi:Cyclic nucleotide-binding domain